MKKIVGLLCLGFVLGSQCEAPAIVLKQSKDMTEACLWFHAATERSKQLAGNDCKEHWAELVQAYKLKSAALQEGITIQGDPKLLELARSQEAFGNQAALGCILTVAGVGSLAIDRSPESVPADIWKDAIRASLAAAGIALVTQGLKAGALAKAALDPMEQAMLEHAAKHLSLQPVGEQNG